MRKMRKMAVLLLAMTLASSSFDAIPATAKNTDTTVQTESKKPKKEEAEEPAKPAESKPAKPALVSELIFSSPKQSKESIDNGWRSVHGKTSGKVTAPVTKYLWRGKEYSYDEMVHWCLTNTNVEDNYFGVYADDIWCMVGDTYEKTIFDYEDKVYEDIVIEFEAENATTDDISVTNSKGNAYSFVVIGDEICTDKYGIPLGDGNRRRFTIAVDSTGFCPNAFGLKSTGMIVSVGEYKMNLEEGQKSWEPEERDYFWEYGFLGNPHFSQPVFFQWDEFNPGRARIIRYNKDIYDYEWVYVEK